MSTVWAPSSMLFHPNSRATHCFLSGEVIIYWRGVGGAWSASLSSQCFVRGPAQTDVSSTDRCPTWARLPPIWECRLRGGTHGGAKVAGDPGEAGRWADITQLRDPSLSGRSPTLPGQRVNHHPLQIQVAPCLTSPVTCSCLALHYSDKQKET